MSDTAPGVNDAAIATTHATQDIVMSEIFPHAPATIWRALTTGSLIAHWLMEPRGFEPVQGTRFTYQTKPAGAWDGTIHCEVLEVVPDERFVYAWKGGHESNEGYGSRLDTVVTFTLTPVAEGTRLTLVHAGFVTPTNDVAFTNMSNGWRKILPELGQLADKAH
ncbi:MAG: SRPBCC domain-containing protein [Gammaproteobacteria bacterium]|nr:SRPBCC domain-containing protein [Gammaproteobacteria bacterium]MBU1439800.1 SRPBCC domain-containing protein [Gammaproteobacteria bacterium]MBU2288419.1 SRPBCC domain-containing protein [Gammaproteobacteria bacterium]